MITAENIEAKTAKQVERVVINDTLKNKLTKLMDQANSVLQGIATVTKSDIVNLILGGHADDLNPAEIDQLKASHLDEVKYAFWVAKRLKEARAAGETLSMQDVLTMSGPLMAETPVRLPKRPRKKKENADPSTDTTTLPLQE